MTTESPVTHDTVLRRSAAFLRAALVLAIKLPLSIAASAVVGASKSIPAVEKSRRKSEVEMTRLANEHAFHDLLEKDKN